MDTYFNAPQRLIKSLPTKRAAYSDRTAWLMGEMSALAYLPFEKESAESSGDGQLTKNLKNAGFGLVKTFNEQGTQAFLAKREVDKIAVLAFRGTEMNSWKDIKADIDARFYKAQSGARIHTGFRNAYKRVADQVKSAVDGLGTYSLYVTGHSLGGALAVIAAKELERDSLAACYTFGSPRVGDEEFGEKIRTPIYRIVNAADGVPRIPPSWMLSGIVSAISFLKPKWEKLLKNNLCGYLHQGDMRYLTACDELSQVKVIPNLNIVFRGIRLAARIYAKGFKVTGADHKVNGYREKLKAYAEKRNPPNNPDDQG